MTYLAVATVLMHQSSLTLLQECYQDGSHGNTSDLCSGGVGFQAQLEHQLS
jgi:hypothetical protein